MDLISILEIVKPMRKKAATASSEDVRKQLARIDEAEVGLDQYIAERTAAHAKALLEDGPERVFAIEKEIADAQLEKRRAPAVRAELERSLAVAEERELTATVDANDVARQKHRARLKQIDTDLHGHLERAAACMGELAVTERAFANANEFCVAHGRGSLLTPREMLGSLIYKQGEADKTFAHATIPTAILGYFPRPTCEPERNLTRMTEISLPR